jgi:hypothetical protein
MNAVPASTSQIAAAPAWCPLSLRLDDAENRWRRLDDGRLVSDDTANGVGRTLSGQPAWRFLL